MTNRRQGLLAVLLMTVLAAHPALGEGATISGLVSDESGIPLPGANLVLSGPSLEEPMGTAARADGEYSFAGLEPGSYQLEVSHIGYRTLSMADIEIEAGASKRLDVELPEAVIYLEQSIVSASRSQEKALDAPASVAVVEGADIRDRPVLSVGDHVRDLPGVDFAKSGLVQSNAVVRGFNNVFSGAMLTLTDNRIARVPSLRVNAYNFIPVVNEDIERIEVVLGPGSALYGPNSARGVMHIITRSPFASAGTNVRVGMGERSLRKGAVRHAGIINPNLAFKLSAQYYTGNDWEYEDPVELKAREANPDLPARDFGIERQSAEARLDYRMDEDLSAVVSGGYNRGDQIELTGLGAGQAVDWAYNYVQARFVYRNLFAQWYRNWSDAGDTFLLRNGDAIVDKSNLNVFQLQHAYALGGGQRFTYGIDALLTRPDTEGTITGRNEDEDGTDEYGAYLQSETDLGEQLDLVLALRYDQHNRLDDGVLSPRAGLVFKPRQTQTLRLTYNRAFDTPSTNNLYLERLGQADPYGLGSNFEPVLGFSPAIDIRAQGTYREGFDGGFTFRHSNGRPMYRTPFQPLIARQLGALGLSPGDPGYSIQEDGFIAMDDPVATGVMWGVARQAVLASFTSQLQVLAPELITQQLLALGMEADDARATAEAQTEVVVGAMPSLVPEQLPGLANAMLALNLETGSFDPAAGVFDVPRTRPTITQTVELGYKGIVGDRLVVAADVYRSDIEDFVGPLKVETPNVFLDPGSLAAALGPAFTASLGDPDNAEVAQVLGALDEVSIPGIIQGNKNGSPVDELTTLFAGGAAGIPFGTVSPEQAYDPNAVLMTYRNFGSITLYGLDLSAVYYPNDRWSVSGNFSFVNDAFFEALDGIADISLNAPKQKFKLSTSYRMPDWNLRVRGSVRYNGSFRQDSGVFVGDVDPYTLVDLNAAYDLPFGENLSLMLNVDNVLNSSYRSWAGAPEIGRLAYLQLGVNF